MAISFWKQLFNSPLSPHCVHSGPSPPAHSPNSNPRHQVIPLSHPRLRKPQLLPVACKARGLWPTSLLMSALTAALHAHSTPATLTSCSLSVSAYSFSPRGLCPQIPVPPNVLLSLPLQRGRLTAEARVSPRHVSHHPPLLMSSGHFSQSVLASCFSFMERL